MTEAPSEPLPALGVRHFSMLRGLEGMVVNLMSESRKDLVCDLIDHDLAHVSLHEPRPDCLYVGLAHVTKKGREVCRNMRGGKAA